MGSFSFMHRSWYIPFPFECLFRLDGCFQSCWGMRNTNTLLKTIHFTEKRMTTKTREWQWAVVVARSYFTDLHSPVFWHYAILCEWRCDYLQLHTSRVGELIGIRTAYLALSFICGLISMPDLTLLSFNSAITWYNKYFRRPHQIQKFEMIRKWLNIEQHYVFTGNWIF